MIIKRMISKNGKTGNKTQSKVLLLIIIKEKEVAL